MEYKDINDFEVLYLVEENQSDYKSIIFKKYKPILSKLSYSYYSRLKNCGYDYDDCYQEALIGLNYAIDNFKINKNAVFYTYAILCIKGKLNSFYTKAVGVKNKILNESLYCSSDDMPDIEDLSITYFDDTFLSFYDKVLKFKNSLNDVQSQIFELRYNGFSNKDIALLLDISSRTVSNNLCMIKNKMIMSNFAYTNCKTK